MQMHKIMDAYLDQREYYNFEGRRGVERLCQLVGDLGYRDPQHSMQLTRTACVGNLLMFLEDNPGAIEAIENWVRDINSKEMVSSLADVTDTSALCEDDDEDEDGEYE